MFSMYKRAHLHVVERTRLEGVENLLPRGEDDLRRVLRVQEGLEPAEVGL